MQAYRDVIEQLSAACLLEEPIYARGDRNVQFTVYDREDGTREIYFIATDWHRPSPDGVGYLRLGNVAYEIPVPWGQLVKVVAHGNCALYPEKDENEVIRLDGNTARVQGVGLADFVLCKNGTLRTIRVDFSESGVREIEL